MKKAARGISIQVEVTDIVVNKLTGKVKITLTPSYSIDGDRFIPEQSFECFKGDGIQFDYDRVIDYDPKIFHEGVDFTDNIILPNRTLSSKRKFD